MTPDFYLDSEDLDETFPPGRKAWRRKRGVPLESSAIQPEPTVSLGFRFTPLDEIRIERAKQEAMRFMQNYGKGRQPFMIDKSNYD